jgi:hypothetical protein
MSDDRFEEHLREIPLNGPGPEVKRRLVQRAAARMRGHRRGRTVRLVLAAAAGLLIAVNLVFGQMHEARLAAIIGPEALQSVEGGGPIYADAFAERQRLMGMLLEDSGLVGGGDEDGERALPDLQTNRQWHGAFVA